jgi:hypothetical protein
VRAASGPEGWRYEAPLLIFGRPLVASGSSRWRGFLFQGASPLLPFPSCHRSDARRFLLAVLRVSWLRFLWRGVTTHSHHSLVQTLLCIRALSQPPVTLFYFPTFPALPHFPSATSRFPPGAKNPDQSRRVFCFVRQWRPSQRFPSREMQEASMHSSHPPHASAIHGG